MRQKIKDRLGEILVMAWFFIFALPSIKSKIKENIFLILALLSFTSGTILFISSIATQKDQFPIGNLYTYIIFLLGIGILFACHACNQIRSGCFSTLEIENEME